MSLESLRLVKDNTLRMFGHPVDVRIMQLKHALNSVKK